MYTLIEARHNTPFHKLFLGKQIRSKGNMIVIRTTQRTMKAVGLLFTASETLPYKIYRWISFAILCVLFEPSCHFLLENYTDLIKATEVCIYIAAEGVMMVKAIFMFYNWKLIRDLLNDLQIMANKRIRIGRSKFLVKLDKEAEKICKYYLGVLVVATCIWCGGPVSAILYRTFTKTYVPHMYGHPFRGVYPFDYQSTPAYELVYVLNIVYNIYLSSYFAACDIFFVSCGLHLVGATQEVEDFLLQLDKDMDEIVAKNEKRRTLTGSVPSKCNLQISLYLQPKFEEAIKDHYEIIRIKNNLVAIEEGIIFSQFFGVLFSLSAIAFQMVIANREQQFFFIGPTVVILCQLFLYCYYGQRTTDQACQLSESIYQLKWYNYPVKFQKYFQLIMLRSQNSSYFNGLGFVRCSLQSFTDVLKFVGSVVALFRSIQD